MPRTKVPCYIYNNEGMYVTKFDSLTEAKQHYYNNPKYPIFTRFPDIHELPNGYFLTLERIGRTGILEFLRRSKDPYIKENYFYNVPYEKRKGLKEVELYNRDGSLIATFQNVYIAALLLKIRRELILQQLDCQDKLNLSTLNLRFKYKK